MNARIWGLALVPLTLGEALFAEPQDTLPTDRIEGGESAAPFRDDVQARPLKVSTGRASDLVGRPMYADRSAMSAGAMQIAFSDRPVVPLAGRGKLSAGVPPLRGGRMSSAFGYRRHPIDGDWRLHSGVDLAASLGAPVVAAQAGTVRSAGWRGGYGLLVTLEHGGGLETRYGHLSRIAVSPGQAIAAGEVLGFVGSTGNSTGPHLHYETRQNGRAYDPMAR